MMIPENNAYYVYLILCEDHSLYCGWTVNLKKRYEKHKSGNGAKYTRSHKPKELVYYECFDCAALARKREAAIKKLTHQEKLELVKYFHGNNS